MTLPMYGCNYYGGVNGLISRVYSWLLVVWLLREVIGTINGTNRRIQCT